MHTVSHIRWAPFSVDDLDPNARLLELRLTRDRHRVQRAHDGLEALQMFPREPPDLVPLGRWRHEMKNQLGIILGFSDLLLQELEPSDARRADLQEIRAAAARSMELLGLLPVEKEASGT